MTFEDRVTVKVDILAGFIDDLWTEEMRVGRTKKLP